MNTTHRSTIQYDYIVRRISDESSSGFMAIMSAFDSVVFGDNLTALEQGITLAIQEKIAA